ncbi:CocE/NonD family hydrolase [Bacteroidota bacterium]
MGSSKTTSSSIFWLTGIIFLASSCIFKPGKSEIEIIMPDDIALSTDVFIPKGGGKYPTILIRTPYNKENESWAGKAFGIKRVAVVIQDVRGKYESGGEFYPFINERKDGLQTLNWIREQPWSNGYVAGWGGSYVGYTQWAISDSLDFMVPMLTGADLYDLIYPDGLFSLQSAFTWGLTVASSIANTIPPEKIKDSFRILPLSIADDSTIHDIPFLNDWLSHETDDYYWRKMNHRGITKAPVLSIAGWYDIFLKSQIEDFQALQAQGHTDSRLIIGPLCHGSPGVENDYGGTKKTGNPMKMFLYAAKKVKGKKKSLPSPLKDKKYNLFIMERNEYFGSDVWPPRETRFIPYYIGPDNHFDPANCTSDGLLSYDYDPLDPFPSLGGTALGEKVGPAEQNDNINRSDQLSFETKNLDKPLILLGPITASLWLSSDTPCTDFIVCLQDVFPDGKIINIQEGGAKVQFDGDDPTRHEISVWATGYQLNTGHKLRVVITSSWFPRYNRNLNDCSPIADALSHTKTRQMVYYGTETPSSIILPVFDLNK